MEETHDQPIKKPRSHKGSIIITPRDRWVLEWIADQYAATLDQIQMLLGRRPGRGAKIEGRVSESAARQVIDRWRKLGLVQQRRIIADTPSWVFLTQKGLLELGLSYRPNVPRLVALPHLHAVNHVRLFVEARNPDDEWVSERELRAEQQQRKAGEDAPHIPDAEVWRGNTSIALEVELSIKDHERLVAIMRELAELYDYVSYFVSETTAGPVTLAKEELSPREQERVVICSLKELTGYFYSMIQ